MSGRLSFDVRAQVTDPLWRAEHQPFENRVLVVFGGPLSEPPVNSLTLWLTDPGTVLSLGQALTTAGMRLAAQLRTSLPGVAEPGFEEDYPVPDKKPGIVATGEGC